jgi:hypothetical protein
MPRILILTLIIFLCSISEAFSQYSQKKTNSRYEAYTDSLKIVEYNYVFPIFGQNVYKRGFDIPYPAGIMANFYWMKQNLIFDNMQLGLKTDSVDIPLTPVEFIEFGDNINTSYTINVRPDLWIFPFLNIYGIFGYGTSITETNIVAPISLTSTVEQNVATYGLGTLVAFGIGPIWLSADANFTWNKPELLDTPVQGFVMGIRAGHTFVFKNRPYRNIGIWVGTMFMSLESATAGQIRLGDAIPGLEDKADEIVAEYNEWYDALGPLEKKIVDETPIPNIIDRIDNADGDAVVRYGMDKQVKQKWNGVIGFQFQLNKRWMFRTEGGVIGNRKSILGSINYRFLI